MPRLNWLVFAESLIWNQANLLWKKINLNIERMYLKSNDLNWGAWTPHSDFSPVHTLFLWHESILCLKALLSHRASLLQDSSTVRQSTARQNLFFRLCFRFLIMFLWNIRPQRRAVEELLSRRVLTSKGVMRYFPHLCWDWQLITYFSSCTVSFSLKCSLVRLASGTTPKWNFSHKRRKDFLTMTITTQTIHCQ